MKAVEHDDYEAGDAAEGEGVGPEAPGLELPCPSPDVHSLGATRVAPGGRGEEAEAGEGKLVGENGR